MSVRLYLTLDCMAGVPGCVSERCMCLCHSNELHSHVTQGGYVTTFTLQLEGTWPEVGQARFHEQWLIAQWGEAVTRNGGRPLGFPTVWVDLEAYGITNQCPPDQADAMGRLHGKQPGSPALWHAEGPAERPAGEAETDDVSGQ